ncbi:MAG TPA: hypothetical protein VJR23_03445, partial [Candidatus Acidoferrales bacterium]|nr:hypothetical protein [Candidatus Acidoferrales bacterium]
MEIAIAKAKGVIKVRRGVLAAALALFGAALLAQSASAANIQKLGRECHEGKQKSCEELAKIATESKNSDSREEAVRFLTDQPLLIRIAVKDKDPYVRRVAVSVMNETSALELLKELSDGSLADSEVSSDALEKIHDQSLEFQAALDCKAPKMRLQAANALTDQSLLSRLALESSDDGVQS